jgi:RNA polymerase sigma-70 factor (ECF subfamily)
MSTEKEARDLDESIAAHLRAGDAARAATEAIRRLGPQILGYLNAVLRNETDANEVFSIFCEDLWRGLPGFRRASSFRTWAYRITWHAVVRYQRDPYRLRSRRLATDELSALVAEVRTTAIPCGEGADDALAKLRQSLGPEEQTLLILRVDRDMSWAEIAQVMSEEPSRTVEAGLRKRFERLKEKLRREAATQGLTPRQV